MSRLFLLGPVVALLLCGCRLLRLLRLDGRQCKLLAYPVLELLPHAVVPQVLVPRQGAHPRLDVVVQPQDDVVRLGDLARRVRDLVLGALVLDGEFTAVGECQ